MRAVLDSNVLLPAVFGRGICEAVLDLFVTSPDHVLVLSDYILEELARHGSKFGAPAAEIAAAVRFLRTLAVTVQPTTLRATACPDPGDLAILGTAIAGSAEILVTGDAALRAVGRFGSVEILTPREFYDRTR